MMNKLVRQMSRGSLRRRTSTEAEADQGPSLSVRPEQVHLVGQLFSADLGGSVGTRPAAVDAQVQVNIPFATHLVRAAAAVRAADSGSVPPQSESSPLTPASLLGQTLDTLGRESAKAAAAEMKAASTEAVAAGALASPTVAASMMAAVTLAASAPAASSRASEQWTLSSWLASRALHERVAAALLPSGTSDELGFVRRDH